MYPGTHRKYAAGGLAALILSFLLSGCGVKGPLKPEQQPQENETTATTQTPSFSAEVTEA